MMKMIIATLLLVALIGYASCATTPAPIKPPKAPNFDADFLAAHNNYRKLHGCKPLAYNATLNKFAQDYANQLAAKDVFVHSGGPYGENLYYSWSSVPGFTVPGKAAVDSWYSEISNYNFATGAAIDPKKAIGHFTQVVWKASTQLGVGAARSKTNKVYVVGEYWPRGNYVGQYIANVPKKIATGK